MTIVDKLVIALGLDASEFEQGLSNAMGAATNAADTATAAQGAAASKAGDAAAKGAEGIEAAQQKTAELQRQMQAAGASFDELGAKWAASLKGIALNVAAPVAAALGIWKGISGYASQVGEVATLTGAYSEKLEEWRKKRALLSRVTREDIELYKKARTGIVDFQIAMQDLSARIARVFAPALEFALDVLNGITKWVNANQHNIVRAFTVAAGVITAVFLPAIVRMGIALMANPLTWVIAALGALVLVIDDLVTYMRGGQTTLGSFWAIFGTGEELTETLTAAGKVLIDTLKTFAPLLISLGGAFAVIKTGTAAFAMLQKAVMAVRAAFLVLAANPVALIVGAIAAAVYYLITVFQRAESIDDFLNILVDDFSRVLEVAGNFVGFIVGALLNSVMRLGAALLEFLGFDGLADSLRDFAHSVFDFFRNLGTYAANGVIALRDLGQEAIDALRGFITSLPARIASAIGSLVDRVSNAITDAYNRIVAWLDGLPALFLAAFDGIAESIKGIFKAAWDFIVNLFDPSAIVNKIKNGLSSFGDKVVGFFGWGEGDEEESESAPPNAKFDPIARAQKVSRLEPENPAYFDANAQPRTDTAGAKWQAWANAQPPLNAPSQTQTIQNSVNNVSNITDRSTKSQQRSVVQNNSITINTNGDPAAIQKAMSQEMALQNAKLQRQTMAVETGTRT